MLSRASSKVRGILIHSASIERIRTIVGCVGCFLPVGRASCSCMSANVGTRDFLDTPSGTACCTEIPSVMPAGDEAMSVLQLAALDNIDRLTPYNIASTVWALGKMLRTPNGAASADASMYTAQQPGISPAASLAHSTATVSGPNVAISGRPKVSDPCQALRRPSYPAAGANYASSDSDAGAFSSGEDFMEGWGPAGSRQPANLSRPGRGANSAFVEEADVRQLLDGLAAAAGRCARQFKPAHVGDALWGFGCLGLSPGDSAVSELLSAAAAAREPGLRPADAACALVGLAMLATIGDGTTARLGTAPWLMERRQTLGLLSTKAGGGLSSLRPESAEEVCFEGQIMYRSDYSAFSCSGCRFVPKLHRPRLTPQPTHSDDICARLQN